MELRDHMRILRDSWILIVAATCQAVSAASVFSIVQTPTSSTTSKAVVLTESGGTTSDLVQGAKFAVARVKTYARLATTPLVLLPVIESLDLRSTAVELAKRIAVSAPLDTSIRDISVTDTDPVRAAEIANAVAQSLADEVKKVEQPDDPTAASPVKLPRVQVATVPTSTVSPNVPLHFAWGALVGLALSVGLAVLRETLDTRIRTQRDVEQITDVPVIGGILFHPKAIERPLIVHVDPRSSRAESFRTLRTNLQYLDVERADRSFVITSSIGSEGKSTTSANLAISLADSGARVLLVDADLRRPRVADYMNIEGGVGLTDVLIGRAALSDVIQPWGRGQLFVLLAGHIPPNPSEMLGSSRMKQVIEDFNRTFDVVIFDSPPLLPVTDAAILAKSVGVAILIVAAGRTQKAQLKGAIAALASVGAPSTASS
ncbi:polysaccharide biosynthesis tyrosine autokinase [Cryobacterium sp. Hh38]|uniref:polysaccharide biosynthesis tyrosine autokinase n=1 Tax=Cryobacterium sp. Hh38 TaxID=1259156 RepID=UPI001F5438F5|nr:polysaccharide biosynthesis tyrosine autokinase [Cryobacterium sp. Hh38]